MLALAADGLLHLVIVFLGVLVCFGILWWATDWVVTTWKLPDIVPKVVRSVIVLVLVIFLIDLISAICGGPKLLIW